MALIGLYLYILLYINIKMPSGEVWTAQEDISQNTLYVPVFSSFFDEQIINNTTYHQTLNINNKTYYLKFKSPNEGTYVRDNATDGTFKYVRGILTVKDASGNEVEKFKNNHGTEIDHYDIMVN